MENFSEAFAWLEQHKKPHLLLGNGFSMAYKPDRFGYAALAQRAKEKSLLSDDVAQVMSATGTTDFEALMRSFLASSETLKALGSDPLLITRLEEAASTLREALAQSIAGLHPDRPHLILPEQYLSTRVFLDRFAQIYTVNYDLLLYWSLMQELGEEHPSKGKDDGFRDSKIDGDDTVLWNLYNPHSQTVHYLHGALHLFLGQDGLRKITWIRTNDALIDQVRRQLSSRRFPLYVAEGTSAEKLDRINRSAYLSKSLRSLTSCGGSLLTYGHSLDENDDHVLLAIAKSKISKIAVSIFGDANSEQNKKIIQRAKNLSTLREQEKPTGSSLEVTFYDAATVELWKS